jgi:hypothetical protein
MSSRAQNEKKRSGLCLLRERAARCITANSACREPAGRQQQLEYKVHRKTSLTGQWRDSLELRESLAVITNFLDRLVVQSARPKKEEEERDEKKIRAFNSAIVREKIIKKDGRRRQDGIV